MKPYTDSKRFQEFSAGIFVQKVWSMFENLSKEVKKADFTNGAEIQLSFTRNVKVNSYKSQSTAKSILLWIAHTITVCELREITANAYLMYCERMETV